MNTKICTKCGQELPLEDFPFRDKTKGIRRANCKKCHNDYEKKYFISKERRKQSSSLQRLPSLEKYQERKQMVTELKAQVKCAKCGEDRGYCLDYHHIDPATKKFTIAHYLANSTSMSLLEEEIKKCIVLCANCHREFHFLEGQDETLTLDRYIAG